MGKTIGRISIALTAAAMCCGGILPGIVAGTGAAPLNARAAAIKAAPTPAARPPAGSFRFGNRGGISGKLTAETAASLTVQGFGGTQTIAKSSAIKFFSAARGNLSAIKPGLNITVRTGASAILATSVTLVPAGNLFGLVQAFSARGPRPKGTPRPGTFPQRSNFSLPTTGTVVALKGTSLTIKTVAGAIETGSVNSQTEVYVFSPVAAGTIKVGAQVTVATTTTNGHPVAIALAISSIPNTMARLSTSL